MDYSFNTNMSAPRSYAEALAAQDELERQRQQELAKQLAAETVAAQAPQTQQPAMSAPNNGLAATAAPYAPMDSAARMIAQQVYNTKGLYDEAAKAGDTDTMNRASAFANQLREAGQKYGIDTSRFGADVTRDQLGALLQNDYAKAITDVGNMLTPQEHYAQSLENYKAQGVSDRRSKDLALADLKRYEGEYARKMAVAMDAYGLNDNGSMNQHSGLIQTLAYLNNPMGAAIYDRYYANPKEQWQYDKELEAAGYMNGLKMALGDRNFEHTRALNSDKYAFAGDQADKDRAFKANQAAQQHAFKKDLAAWAAGLDVDKQEALLQLAAKYGMDPADIFGKRGGGSSGNRDTEPPKQEAIAIQNIQDLYNKGRQTLSNVQETINEMERIKEKISDPDTRSLIQDMEYALNAEREGVSWNDHGQSGDSQNFIDYYEAVKNHPELVKHLEKIYEAAKASKSSGGGNY